MLKFFILYAIFAGFYFRKTKENGYLKSTMIILFLTIGLRNKWCYKDTIGYVEKYQSLEFINFSKIGEYFIKDTAFYSFSKVTQLITFGNYTLWFVLLAILYVIPLYMLLKKYSQDRQVSLLFFCVLGFSFFILTGIRQTMAMSFTMMALFFLLERKWKWCLLCMMMAPLFHKTSVIFFVAFPLFFLPFNKKMIAIYIIAFAFIFKVLQPIIELLVLVDDEGRFGSYQDTDTGLNFTGFFIQVIIFVSSWFMLGEHRKEKKYQFLLSLSLLAVLFQSMSGVIAEMFRMSMYFSISSTLVFADGLTYYIRKRRLPILKLFVIFFVSLYIVIINENFKRDYYFFFQTPNIEARKALVE